MADAGISLKTLQGALGGLGGVLKIGQGFMGKTAVVLLALLAMMGIAIWKLQSDVAIVAIVVLGLAAVTGWFLRMEYYTENHPELASLEGAQLLSYWRWQARTKAGPKSVEAIVIPDPDPAAVQVSQQLMIDSAAPDPDEGDGGGE